MKRRGFTLVEMLVVVTIIAILGGMLYGALQMARETAREMATKSTIAKLNNIILRQYESYRTRRVSLDTSGMTPQQAAAAIRAAKATPRLAAKFRLDAIRDIIRMEMPDARSDVVNGPVAFDWGSVPAPALHRLYNTNPPAADHDAAQCLYMIVSIGQPEAMEQFHQSEIGTIPAIDESGNPILDGTGNPIMKPVFIDGWGRPIMFLRWAPGYTSPVQSGDEENDHDPFDTRRVDGSAFHLIPLIYSAGSDGIYDINLVAGYVYDGNPYADMDLGRPTDVDEDGSINHHDNITNHRMDQR